MKLVYAHLHRTDAALMPFSELTHLMGFEDIWAFERRYAGTP